MVTPLVRGRTGTVGAPASADSERDPSRVWAVVAPYVFVATGVPARLFAGATTWRTFSPTGRGLVRARPSDAGLDGHHALAQEPPGQHEPALVVEVGQSSRPGR